MKRLEHPKKNHFQTIFRQLQHSQKMSDIEKDCGRIWMRLFDHRPFLNGEIRFMLREFEEKRKDREIENLFSVIENLTEIKDNQIDRLKLLSNTHLPELSAQLDEALKECDNIKQLEEELEKSKVKQKEEKQEERKKEWTAFIEDINQKYVRIDNAFEQKEEELKDFYADLEHKLKITTK